jgi:ankyrin repeat protein
LEAGADPNWQVPDTGNSSLHDAVKQIKQKTSKVMSEIIRLLLLKGGDSNVRNKQQKTVYDYAERALLEYKRIEDKIREEMAQ